MADVRGYLEVVGKHWGWLVFSALFGAAGAADAWFGWRTPGSLWIIGAVLSLVVAQFMAYDEKATEVASVQSRLTLVEQQLAAKRTSKKIADALTKQYGDGVDLLKWGPIMMQDDWREWKAMFSKWSTETYQLMKQLDCTAQEIVAFNNLNPADIPTGTGVSQSADFQKWVDEYRAGWGVRVNKLGDIIDNYLEVPILRGTRR